MKNFDLIIFDWAGTTVDYGCFAPMQAFIEEFKSRGITPTMEEVRAPMGMLKIDHIRTMLKMPRILGEWIAQYGSEPEEADVQVMYDRYEKHLLSILPNFTDPKPGVIKTVQAIKGRGIHIGSTTGYNDKMMGIVVPNAASKGFSPDYWVSPDAVEQKGRPYPYMVFENMKKFAVHDVRRVIKVGDTVSDIEEGKNAGVYTVGVLEGSSQVGLTEEEYLALDDGQKLEACERAADVFREAGADAVIYRMEDLLVLI